MALLLVFVKVLCTLFQYSNRTLRHATYFLSIGWQTLNWVTAGKRILDVFKTANRQPHDTTQLNSTRVESSR